MDETTTQDAGNSPWQRMVGIFFAPRATFIDLTQSITRQDLWIPLSIVLAVSLGAQTMIRPVMEEKQLEYLEQRDDLTDEQRDAAIAMSDRTSGGILGYTLGIGANLVWFLILGGVVMFLGSFILGGQLNYRDTFVLVVYAHLISVLEYAIKVPLILQTNSLRIKTGLSLLLPDTMSDTLLYRFFTHLDFFSIWRVFLLSIGTAILYKVSEKNAKVLFFGAWLLAMFLIALLFKGRGLFG